MNGRQVVVALVALVCVAGAGFAFQGMERELETRGEVVAISIEEGILTLEEAPDLAEDASPEAMQSGVRKDFVVNDETELTAAGKAIELQDIAVGSFATVHYILTDGEGKALAIDVYRPSTD